ncbi:methionine--tRNA ligase [Pseudalkalibacillus berkeleyi]|uniref:Methionine--tRNA ligase n=1 Tax=Pseudalkalibacillus berkeleyi TaxID=1069813 RepID=A0ABS9H6E9_9BACL|nr:methionine--tRNA ligase [Pseudalkalibacillus berkeleyi]MCF6139255.1 methionine--tRNA ligase [Pseudalkalibacillus berkeleyi]
MSVFIGGAWPYANGSLHLGHLASLLPGDILARYYRLKGEDVLYVSGSDCNGTPIALRAKNEGVEAKVITDRYHTEFKESFDRLGFTYDQYVRTDHPDHHKEVQHIFKLLVGNGHCYKKKIKQSYCSTDEQFLPDRYVEGVCPVCGSHSRGDQCENCSTILDPVDLIDPICKLCGNTPVIKETEHYYFNLKNFQSGLNEYLAEADHAGKWRTNAIQMTKRYLTEGLRDRAATRDIELGVPVPMEGFEGKKIYVWIEAVSGYLTASMKWAEEHEKDWRDYWNDSTKSYYVHGKDNIPFHSIIWPAILKGVGGLKLPDHIISSEYLTVEKKKLSTSRNWAVWVPDLLENYHPDSIRYYLAINGPEQRDADFSWREFIYSHNSELLGAYGNFVNRTLKFVEKSYGSCIPEAKPDEFAIQKVKDTYTVAGKAIEKGEFKYALEAIFDLVRSSNKYFDERQPWKQVNEAPDQCAITLNTCTQIIANLGNLLSPFLPFSAEKIQEQLAFKPNWSFIELEPKQIKEVKPLFDRIDIHRIEGERAKLGE